MTTNFVLDELADASRRAILDELRTGAKSVSVLVEQTGLKQPNVSNHLAKMRERGIVAAQRSGRHIFYSLANPLVEEVLNASLSGTQRPSDEPPTPSDVITWAEHYFEALTAGNEREARRVVSECLTRRLPLEDLYVDVFEQSLVRVGEWYLQGRLSEAQEHHATSVTERLMARASQFYPPDQARKGVMILGAVAGNWHSLGLRMIADLLQHQGWHIFYLGANVPTEAFVKMVQERRPDAVMVSCALEETAEETRHLVRRLQALREPPGGAHFEIGVGGAYANGKPDFARSLGADFTAPHVRALGALLENRRV